MKNPSIAKTVNPWFWIGIGSTVLSLVLLGIVLWVYHHPLNASFVLTIFSTTSSLAVTFVSLALSNKWYGYFVHFKNWGIEEVEGNREAGDKKDNDKYIDRIKSAKHNITIIGTALGFWFDGEFGTKFLNHLKDSVGLKIEFYFLHPNSEGFHLRAMDEKLCTQKDDYTDYAHLNHTVYTRLISSMNVLKNFIVENKDKIKIYTYDTTPIGMYKIDDDIYLTHYLPYEKDKYCPELHLTSNGKMYNGSIKDSYLRITQENRRLLSTDDIRTIISIAERKDKDFMKAYNAFCQTCDFCRELDGYKDVKFLELYPNIPTRMIKVNSNFTIFPSLGHLSDDHLLIVANEHYNSIGQLRVDFQNELSQIMTGTSLVLKETFIPNENNDANVLFFEHGVFDDSGTHGGCGISHMHLHALTYKKGWFEKLMDILRNEHQNNVREVTDFLSETRKCAENNQTYVLVTFGDEKYIITSNENKFESQYMRKKVAEAKGETYISWKDRKDEREYVQKLHNVLKSKKFI